ncbi:putative transmembrane protein [Tieghemostelium lacteum]|uniref:Putative transmembrane protein n=1 Tax=Tieghemostelium lacteum TaxID=361077 RepID=A0A151ZEX1_TIELA|nr:putative transmembrane protein [Tieghemostelium lacteum]|eukprot:KYQ92467.1 putative transmembrane protein [Tieghemostelium lacteum]
MKIKIVLHLLIIYLIFVNNVSADIKTARKVSATYDLWSDNIWTPAGTPTGADDAKIPVNGHTVVIAGTAVVNSVVVGNTTNSSVKSVLHAASDISTNNIDIQAGSQLIFNNLDEPFTPYTMTLFSPGYYLNTYGLTAFLEETKWLITGPGINHLRPNAEMQNSGITTFDTTFVTNTNSTLHNWGTLLCSGDVSLLTGIHKIYAGSVNQFVNNMTLGNNALYQTFPTASVTTNGHVQAFGNALLYYNGTTIKSTAVNFNKSDPNPPVSSMTFFELSENAILGLLGGSVYTIDGLFTNLFNQAQIVMGSSTLLANNTILVRDNGLFSMEAGSVFNSTGFLMFNINSTLEASDSTMTIIDNTLGLFNTSRGILKNTVLSIKVVETVRGVLGVFDDASLSFYENSQFLLDGVFLVYNQGKMLIDKSKFIVKNLFFLDNNGVVGVTGGSLMNIENAFAVRGNATFILMDSVLSVTSNITFYSTSTFTIANSSVSVNGFFEYNVVGDGLSVVQASNITVSSGYFSNYGVMAMENTNVFTHSNFSNFALLESTQSNFTVEAGVFYSSKSFHGSNSRIQVNNGLVQVESNSIFNCIDCEITILNGYFKQGVNATINLNNTEFTNQQGSVEASGNINLFGGRIANGGEFTLKADITPLSGGETAKVTNTGTFSITGSVTSNIQAPFSNNGKVNVEQSTNFKELTQEAGSFKLLKNSKVQSELFVINGGDVSGSGTIKAPTVSVVQGSFGTSNSPDKITVDGDFEHHPESEMVVTLDSEDNTFINITQNAILNGTLVIRVDESLLNATTTNTTTPVVQFNSTQGTFKKIQVVTYNKDTGKSTLVADDCKIKTEKAQTSFAVLLTPNDEREQCSGSASSESTTTSSSKKKISNGAIIGIVVGIVGAAGIVCAIYFIKHKTDGQLLTSKLRNLTGKK